MPNPPLRTNSEWTILQVLQWAHTYFKNRGIESPRAAAEILLAHALGTDRIHLYMHHDQPLDQAELARFKTFIQRRLRREPVAYIVGHKGFWSLDLSVTPAVLIPRPETERLVEAALAWLANRGSGATVDVMDLGTGSGAIVAAIASEARAHRFFASDISSEAIAIARGNAEAAGVAGNVRFFVGDWLSAVRPGPIFDLILSNPPYVASGTWSDLQPEIVHYEPRLALDGDEDGLRSYRAIVGAAHRYLKPGGALMMEIGYAQREAVQILAEQSGAYDTYTCIQDYSGHDRVVAMHKKILHLIVKTANKTCSS
jgi:release factor glutamine methyltransferase